jgi:hypothetical protein
MDSVGRRQKRCVVLLWLNWLLSGRHFVDLMHLVVVGVAGCVATVLYLALECENMCACF